MCVCVCVCVHLCLFVVTSKLIHRIKLALVDCTLISVYFNLCICNLSVNQRCFSSSMHPLFSSLLKQIQILTFFFKSAIIYASFIFIIFSFIVKLFFVFLNFHGITKLYLLFNFCSLHGNYVMVIWNSLQILKTITNLKKYCYFSVTSIG